MNKPSAVTPAVYLARVTPLEQPERYQKAYAAVGEYRRQKTDAFRFSEDRYRSLGAELLLIHALRAAGVPYNGCPSVTPGGKPYLPGGGAFFSLSHAGEYALCAVAPFLVGCDLEKITAAEEGLAKKCLTPAEYAAFAACPAGRERDTLFFRFWTKKESYMKQTGQGLHLPPESVDTLSRRPDAAFTEWAQPAGYRCAVCSQKPAAFAMQWVDLTELPELR